MSGEIVGYTYRAENLCPDDAVAKVWEGQSPTGMSAEAALDLLAGARGINREEEHLFDSGEFPKVILEDQIEDDEVCPACLTRIKQ